MTLAAHILAVTLTGLFLAFLLALLRRGHLRAKYVMLWIPTGLAMLAFAAIPGLLDTVALAAGVAYPPALLFMLAIVLLMVVCMHFSWELSRLEERTRLLAERIALESVSVTGERPAATSRAVRDAGITP